MTDEPARARPDNPDNLFEPVPGDYAARGRFSDRSADNSPAIWASEHRAAVSAAGALGALVIAGAALAWFARPPRRGRRA